MDPYHPAGAGPAAAPDAGARGGLPRWLRHTARVLLQLALDAGAVLLAYRLAYEVRFDWRPFVELIPFTGVDPGWGFFAPIAYGVTPLWLVVFWYATGIYVRPWMPAADRLVLLVKAAALGLLATLSAVYIYDRLVYSRLIMALAVPLVVALVWLSEEAALRADRWLSRLEATSPMLIVGGGRIAELVRDNIRARHPGLAIHELEEADNPDGVLARARGLGAGEVVLAGSALPHRRILELAEACDSTGISFKMLPDLLELRLGELQMDDSLGLPAYRIQHSSLSPAHYAVKRATDIATSLAVLAAAGIPLAIVALLIRLDSPGPVFYRQKRLGYKGRVFEVFKFRTMSAGAEAGIEEVKALDGDGQKGGFFKAMRDPRVTRVGRWLRRYSLDEFPQFINVFLGQMSVVGPRPLAVTTGEAEALEREFGPTARKRFNILPGITGLWQVSGRSDTSSQQRFALDMFYIERWSLGMDLDIILKTIPAMLSGKGAY